MIDDQMILGEVGIEMRREKRRRKGVKNWPLTVFVRARTG